MTLTDEIKIRDDKIKEYQAQYDLDTEAAKISPLSSSELEKYECLTGEDLGYKSGVAERKLWIFSIGKVFNNGLDEKDKKEGFLERLKNIEGKNEKPLKAIKDQEKKIRYN